MTGILHEDLRTFMAVSRWILLIVRNVSGKVIEKIKTHFLFNNYFPKIVPFMRMWKIWYNETDHRWQYNAARKDVICLPITKARIQIHTHRYLILFAFPWQQWLQERAKVLRYAFIICRVFKIAVAAPICNSNENWQKVNWKYVHCKYVVLWRTVLCWPFTKVCPKVPGQCS
jgi:hypothetical protein